MAGQDSTKAQGVGEHVTAQAYSKSHDARSDGNDSRLGLTVTHRQYVPYSHAHYAGNLVDGAYVLGLFGDVATEVCIRSDGDEGLFASYSDVQFRAPVHAGDIIEVQATIVRIGRRSREIAFEARIICRGRPEINESAAEVLSDPIIATTATGTVVVPAD